MYTDVNVGLAHDEGFDFDVCRNNPNVDNSPTAIIRNTDAPFLSSSRIYWDLVNNPEAKALDWGRWGVKGTKNELISFLDRYKEDAYAEYLKGKIKELPDCVEYVLYAIET